MPDWLDSWYQLIVVQLVGLLALLAGIWRKLTKPINDKIDRAEKKHDEDHKAVLKRLRWLKRIFKQDSFDIRTKATSIQGLGLANEKRIDKIEHRLDTVQDSLDRIQQTLSDGLPEIRDRLKAVETEMKVRHQGGADGRNR